MPCLPWKYFLTLKYDCILQIALLEWTDDLEVFVLKGYGKSLNYRMGVPLIEDILQSMEQAITAKEGGAQKYKLFCIASILTHAMSFHSYI